MKWIKKWYVQGSNGNQYTVALATDGTWGCSCPHWKFRRLECKHIRYIRESGLPADVDNVVVIKRPEAIPARVTEPMFDEANNRILYPLVPIEPADIHMEATICLFLSEHGWSWQEIKAVRHLPNS